MRHGKAIQTRPPKEIFQDLYERLIVLNLIQHYTKQAKKLTFNLDVLDNASSEGLGKCIYIWGTKLHGTQNLHRPLN